MKKVIFLLFILFSINTFSQYEEGTLILTDDTEINGLIKIATGNRIKYKKNKDSKKKVFTHKEVEKIILKNEVEYLYKIEGKNYLLLKKEINGNLELFSKEYASAPTYRGNGNFSFNNGTYTRYYLTEKYNMLVNELPVGRNRREIIKIFSKACSDCTSFLEKIKDKKTAKKNFNYDYFKMVEYYNQNCKSK